MSKSERKRIISEDRKAIRAWKNRGNASTLPFDADPEDHCETSPMAYTHIAPVLDCIAERLGKDRSELEIYDPYYCAGGTVRHLNKLGYPNLYNKCEDFYEVISKKRVPTHDVLLTNPPYSGDHFDKLLKFLKTNGKPALLLLPEHFSSKSPRYRPDEFCFLSPPERYHYWTPDGMRPEQEKDEEVLKKEKKKRKKQQHRNLVLGTRNSPFVSHWFINMEPVMTNESFVAAANGGKVQLVEGCRVHEKQESILPTNFKGEIQNNEENGQKKKKRRRKSKKQTNDLTGY